MKYNVYIEDLGEETLVGENLPEGQALIRMRNLQKKVCSPCVVVMRHNKEELEQGNIEVDDYDYDKDDANYHEYKDNQ